MIHTTVVIPTIHPPWLDQVLEALRRQRYDLDGTEVLVVGPEKDPPPGHQDDMIHFISTGPVAPPAVARNRGLRQARGEIVCFLDDDCFPEPDWLARLTAPYADPGVHVVGGSFFFPEDDYWTLCDSLAHFAPWLAGVPSGPRQHLPTLNFSARRSVFDRVGEFDEHFPLPAGEDTELTLRMRAHGYTLWLAADALVFHAARRKGLRDIWRRAGNFGRAVGINPLLHELLHPSPLFRHWLVLYTTALPRAALATARIYRDYPALRRHWRAVPGVLAAKVAWMLGVARALRKAKGTRSQVFDKNLASGPHSDDIPSR